jgi:hypothetical protein
MQFCSCEQTTAVVPHLLGSPVTVGGDVVVVEIVVLELLKTEV